MGMVFQHHALVRRATALTNTVHGLMDRAGWRAWHEAVAPAAIRAAAMDALDRVALADRARVRADRLSGGQAQRVAVARALVRDPDLLVADEPAASLDPAAGQEVMRVLCENAGRRTLVFTSHDLGHARAYATRIVALRDGRVVLDAPPERTDPAALDALYEAAA
jgi:phosphonate transport system ATP-binding protein